MTAKATSRTLTSLRSVLADVARSAAEALAAGGQAGPSSGDARFVPPVRPPPADEEESLQGWGFSDTRFVTRPNGHVVLTGRRYNISNVELPGLLPWMAGQLASPLSATDLHESQYPPAIPPPRPAKALRAELAKLLEPHQISDEPTQRLRHGHGHTQAEIWAIRYQRLARVPDLVVFPESEEQVACIVKLALKHDACLVPFGGGTNVTEALRCREDERRPIVSVDMRRMNRILWIDPVNRMASIQAGATGRHIMATLSQYGLTIGHEPDSVEFSTLGGWIATNASGMKKNKYGNIEDLVLDVTAVSAVGTLERPAASPRESVGADPRRALFGSEGNLGIITSAVVKVFPLPEAQVYGSVIFPDFASGFAFLYDLQKAHVLPASVRLMDNTQFHFGQALKPAATGFAAQKSEVEKLLVTKVKGFDLDRLSVATLVFEGARGEVAWQERAVYEIASRHGGMKAGATNGERGYQLTYGIAYVRDLVFDHWMVAESFETSVPWSRALELYDRVQRRVLREHEKRRLPGRPFFTGRVTQIYDTGVCVYFYLGFYAKGVEDPSAVYLELEAAAREEILAAGGSLSHHHGVGKLRERFLKDVMSKGSLAWNLRVKRAVDSRNVFGSGNHGVVPDGTDE